MLPLILISDNSRATSAYIKAYIKKNRFLLSAVFTLHKDPRVITIEQIRELNPLFERAGNDRLLIVIHDFETAKIETQNALLKMLEEKGERVQFILVTSLLWSIMPTVLSRCVVERIQTTKKSGPAIDLSGDLTTLMRRYTIDKKTDNGALVLCDEILSHIHNRWLDGKSDLCGHTISPVFAREVLAIRNGLARNNINPQIAIDHLLIMLTS